MEYNGTKGSPRLATAALATDDDYSPGDGGDNPSTAVITASRRPGRLFAPTDSAPARRFSQHPEPPAETKPDPFAGARFLMTERHGVRWR